MPSLFEPVQAGDLHLANRIAMAPLTRNRAPDAIPTPLMATYYTQRASAGLLITEATAISPQGQGYADVPGLYGTEQLDGWKRVTSAVHAEGGKIVVQLWHVGRVSHTDLQPGNAAPVAPSAIRAHTKTVLLKDGVPTFTDTSMPRALDLGELPGIVQDYRHAARNAIACGFDGVEIHAANGYLINQFISAHSNIREDEYGGSLENRLRLLREIVEAVCKVVGPERLGVRFSPLFSGTDQDRVYIGLVEQDPHHTYIEAVKVLEASGIAYVSIAEADWENAPDLPETFRQAVRSTFSGRIIYAGRYTAERGARLVEAGLADLIAFGRPFIANPDLPQRIFNGWPLNALKAEGLYGGTRAGYVDYPVYAEPK